MRLVCLVLATILVIMFITNAIKAGTRYDEYIDALNSDDFPLKFLYAIGFVWNESSLLSLKGKIRERLIQQARLIYNNEDAEYYANVVWAQILGLAHFFLMASLLLGSALNNMLILVILIAFSGVIISYFSTKMSEEIKKRSEDCSSELPEVVASLALLINSGMILKKAWNTVSYSKDGTIYDLMKESCVRMENGIGEKEAIYHFGARTNSINVKKFTSTLCQGIEKGSSELSSLLSQQSSEMWGLKKQMMLQKGEAASAKMLLPVALMFIGVIIIIFTSCFGTLF